MQQCKLRLRPGLRSGPLLSGFTRADSRRGGGGVKGKEKKEEGRGREPGKSRDRRRRERKEKGRERGEGSWNRAADWLRPALPQRNVIKGIVSCLSVHACILNVISGFSPNL